MLMLALLAKKEDSLDYPEDNCTIRHNEFFPFFDINFPFIKHLGAVRPAEKRKGNWNSPAWP
jgi:hypothetical protein